MSFLGRLFGAADDRAAMAPLYRAVVSAARDPFWYRAGVPDTLDGRFDVIAALLSLVLIRLERDGPDTRRASVLLTEAFVADMDENLRQIGIGDYVVGKHVGRMMGALGGRLGAFRGAAEAGAGFAEPVRRNLFREAPPGEEAVAAVAARLERFHADLAQTGTGAILEGRLPWP